MDSARGFILITGINGGLGRLLAKRLHGVEPLVGLDRRPPAGLPKDITLFQMDIRRKKVEDVFRHRRIRAVVHLGVMHDPRQDAETRHSFNITGTNRLLEFCQKYGVKKVVLLSSANVYGPAPDNSQFLTEETSLLGGQSFSEIRDLVSVDLLGQSFFWKYPDIETVILRPAHIIGPHVHNAPSNFLRMKNAPVLAGFDPVVQFVHEQDVVQALVLSLKAGVRGIFNIVGDEEIPISRAFKTLGHRTLPIPHPLAKSVLKLLYRWRLTSFPMPELDHIRYVCMADGTRAREVLGFKAQYTTREALLSLKEEN